MTPRSRCLTSLPVLAAALAAAAFGAAPAGAGGISSTEAALQAARGREQALSGQVGALNGRIGTLGASIVRLAQRGTALDADLAAERSQARATAAQAAAERRRARRLHAELAHARKVLAARLRSMYESGRPDLVDVVLGARSFGDLLDQASFLKRIGHQDRAVIERVRATRAAAQRSAVRLHGLQVRHEQAVARIAGERAQLASARATFERQRAAYERSRAQLSSALAGAGAQRASLESQLQTLRRQATIRISAPSGSAPAAAPISGDWAIPSDIVSCESGGRNTGPNGAGASGYYQITPGTWKLYGGSTDQAYQAPKSEQDKVAAKIYAGGSGASNWTCAGG